MYEAKAANKNCVKFATGLAHARTEVPVEKEFAHDDSEQGLLPAGNSVNT
jgi:hypothetical protein